MRGTTLALLGLILLTATPVAAQGDWENMGPEWYAVDTMAVDSADVLHIGGLYWGYRYSTDGGETWSTDSGQPMTPLCTVPSPLGPVYSVGDGAVWRSDDHGVSWTPSYDEGLPTESALSALALDVAGGYVYAGTDWYGEIYRSDDDGVTWSMITDTLSDEPIYSLAVGGSGRLFAVNWEGVYVSDDHGVTFGPLVSPLVEHEVVAVAPDGTVYLGGLSVVRSGDNGETWIAAAGGLNPDPKAFTVFSVRHFVFGDQAGEVWLCTLSDGIYHTTDYGDNWVKITDETFYDLYGLARDSAGNLFTAAWDGVWKLPAGSTDAGDWTPQARPRLRPARPNPFNPRTTLSFTLPRDGRAVLRLYDLSGREVRRLLDADLTAGRHELDLDGGGLASGVYIARLLAGGLADMQRLTLVR